MVDWAPKKLVRMAKSSMAKSSLPAEAQAAANGIDAQNWTKIDFALVVSPFLDPSSEEATQTFGKRTCVTDSKGLYDASLFSTARLGITERRTVIEVLIINERMRTINGHWQWASSFQHLANGLTKVSARQAMADSIRRGAHFFKYNSKVVANKKLDSKARDSRLDRPGAEGSIASNGGLRGGHTDHDHEVHAHHANKILARVVMSANMANERDQYDWDDAT